ncbi:MAG: hypothetical protein PHG03_00275 [Bacilli bacterium]|nr:hypothetical protein [Bacilli bacterium]
MHLVSWDSYYLTSGSATPHSDGDIKGEIRVYLISQSTANNTSYLRLDHYIHLGNYNHPGASYHDVVSRYRACGTSCTTYQSKSIALPDKVTGWVFLGSTYHTVGHDSSGGGSFTVNGTIACKRSRYNTENISRATNFYVPIPTIPRYTSITTYTRTNITLNSFRVNWASANTVDRVEYRINSGAWTLGQSGDRTSGNFTITGRNPGTTYNIQIRVRRKDSQLWTESANPSVTTLNIATLNSVPNNIDFEKPFTVTFTRNGASNTSFGIFNTAGSIDFAPYRIVTGTSYTVELTEEEINALFNDMSTVNSKTYRIYLNTNDNNYRVFANRTFNVVNANPIFSNFEYEDINPLTLDLTGNNQTIIKGYSNLKATITSANKMEAIKGANPKEYQLVVGSKQIKKNYHASNNVDLTLNAIDNNVFIVYAIDSRGNSTQKQISPANYINYIKPTINELIVNRQNNISTLTNLSFSGTFFNASFGAAANTLTATYEYRNTKDSNWTVGATALPLTINGNNFNFSGLVAGNLNAEGFIIKDSFEVRVKINDKLVQETRAEILLSAKPNLDLHKDGTSINNPFDETLGNGVQFNGDGIWYNGIKLFGWSGAMPMSMQSETEELKEIETTETEELEEVVELKESEEKEDESIDINTENF